MWVIFDKIEYKSNIPSPRTGKTYSGWEASGTKKGFNEAPDEPWSKVFFDNQATTIIEQGISRPHQSIVQYFQKGVKSGDQLNIKMERDGQFWRVTSISNMSEGTPTYEPLTKTPAKEDALPEAHALPWQA